MVKKGKDWLDFTESGNWNVAADYVRLKIMKWLYLADEYETIATFGTSEMIDEFTTVEEVKNDSKVKAIHRLLKTLKILIDNTLFAVRKKDKDTLKELYDKINKIGEAIPFSYKKVYDKTNKKSRIMIDDERFTIVLDYLIEVKRDVLEPLNKADLIFTSVDEFDPDKLRKELTEDMISW